MDSRRNDLDERDDRWRSRMVAAQAGDSAAYEALLLELLPYVRQRVAQRVREPSEREDVVQNVLLSLHRARHTYRPERAFGPWLRAVVRNATIDWMRARGRRARYEQGGAEEEMAEPSPPAPLPREAELSPQLQRALERLPASQRRAVELIQLEGLSVAEAAERTGATSSAMKVRAHRGYRALRKLLRRAPE